MHRFVFAAVAALGLSLAVAGAEAAPQYTIRIQAGTPQTAQAWVAPRADRYETHFDRALVVNVTPDKTKVRFTCITRGCEFPAQDQPDTVARANPSAYDVTSVKGQAAIKLIVWTVTPENVVVVAQPAGAAQPQARFLLNER